MYLEGRGVWLVCEVEKLCLKRSSTRPPTRGSRNSVIVRGITTRLDVNNAQKNYIHTQVLDINVCQHDHKTSTPVDLVSSKKKNHSFRDTSRVR